MVRLRGAKERAHCRGESIIHTSPLNIQLSGCLRCQTASWIYVGIFAVGAQKHGHHRQNDGGGRVWGPGTLGELPNRLTHRRRSTILKSCSWPSYIEHLLCAWPCAKCFTCPGIHSLTQPFGSGAEQLTLKSRLCLR